ncbi:pilus assembly protein [Variovorax saccharolyticus]|uniref:pilus assembly protein n=1 Tax=Variovorax saccharolyticus TaxID=3053516 RepID=UPI002578DFEF|nr:PilC/PilY family type IV pilus protein [Variovorax sp. J31P216]MDM0027651.1 PilC/PilY family type IV pilus protein [Variovorax sp. J31P216]
MANTSKTVWQGTLCSIALLAVVLSAHAAKTDLADAPLETSSPALVKPNIFFILDDSGSMNNAYLPDWVNNYNNNDALWKNSRFNSIYYDPATRYLPAVAYDGTSYPEMTSANTVAWTAVPDDKYGIQLKTASDLTGSALYYTFSAGEYCTAIDLRSCVAQSAPTTTHPYPAYLRWCNNTALTDCQAVRIETAPSGGKAYSRPRYPGLFINGAKSATGKIVISVSKNSSTTISSVQVDGKEILSGTTAAATTNNTVAGAIAAGINNCTTAISGNCTVSGFSATFTNSTVTITAPSSLGALTASPITTVKSGNTTATPTAFSGGVTEASVPGQNTLTTISSGNTYPRGILRTDCIASTSSCTYAEEMTNFANWWAYYHTRMQMTKTAVSHAFKDMSTSYRLGFMSINNKTGSDFLDVTDITTESGGQKSKWFGKLFAATTGDTTPLKKALSTAGQYYAGKLTKINTKSATDPVQYACQRNYTLLSTDGYWNESTVPNNMSGSELGDVDGVADTARPYFDGNATANTLADIAQYYYTTDIRSSILGNAKNSSGVDVSGNDTRNGPQRMTTFTIGLGVSGYMQYQPDYLSASSGDYYDVFKGTTADSTHCRWQTSGNCNWPVPQNNTQTAVDDLWHTAVNGRGVYYSAGDPISLKDGIANFLNVVDAQNSAGAAVTPSTANVTSTDNYLFDASFTSGQWFGELARYTINPATGIAAEVPDWSQSGTASTTSPTPPTALLDNKAHATRNIYTYDASNGTNTLIPFTWDSLTDTMKNYFRVTALGALSQMCAAGANCVKTAEQIDSTTAGTSTGVGGINLVNFLRGDRSNEGAAGGKYYFQRTHVLGDIVGSQTAYVKRPTFNYPDAKYAAFKTANTDREGMVYVGANDGMLHAFKASTGVESWAYIPSMLLPKLPKLADKNYSRNHAFFVNGSPQQGDAYFDDEWHTILVGGLSAGGRGYYALDVTTPDSPKVLWEFTSDTSKASPYISDADLGYSYGIPIITKLSDGTWAVIVSSGYNNVSPGNGGGHLWVLNAKTGAIISKVSTGIGSATASVAGSNCTAAPCPSGLSRISAWMDNVSINNTVTQVYSGDLFGNVWRFDLSKLKSDGGSASVQLLATLQDANNNPQPISSWIELGFANNSHIVYVGTGSYLGVTDIGSTQVQSIYAIKDPLTTSTATGGLYGSPRATACSATLKTNCFMKQAFTDTNGVRTVSSSMSFATNLGAQRGWFIDLPNTGERINTDSTLQLGMLVFVSNLPNNDNACGTGGSAYLNYLDYKTGLTIRTATNTGVLLAEGNGLGSAPAVLSTPNGKLIASVKLSTGKRVDVPLPPGAGGVGTRRVSWRELITH